MEKKFLFDSDFDETDAPPKEVEEEIVAVEEEEVEEAAPTFSEEDLAEARQEGFAAGKKEGIGESADAVEHQVMESLAKLADIMNQVFSIQEKANDAMSRNAVAVAVSIAGKAFPELARLNALGEVEGMVASVMERVVKQPRLVIAVDEKLHRPLAERIDAVIAKSDYEGKVELALDAELAFGDCRIEWDDGGAERNVAEIWRDIDDIVRRNLGVGAEGAEPPPPRDDDGEADGAGEAKQDGPDDPQDQPVTTGGDDG